MDTKSWIFGGVVSVGVHAVLLAALFAMGSAERQPEPERPIAEKSAQAESAAPEEPSPSPTADTPASPPASVTEYEVKPGDTLSAIAKRVGCTVARLAEVNKSDVRTLSRLRIGQRLILPE